MSDIHETYPTDIILYGEASEDNENVSTILDILIRFYYKKKRDENNDVNDKYINIVFSELSNYIQKTLKVMGEGNGGRYLKRNESQQRWDKVCIEDDERNEFPITKFLLKKVIKQLNLFGPAEGDRYLMWDEDQRRINRIQFDMVCTAQDQNDTSFGDLIEYSADFIRTNISECSLSRDDEGADGSNNAMRNNEAASLVNKSPQEVQAQSAEPKEICLKMLVILEANDAINYFNEDKNCFQYVYDSTIDDPKDFSTIRGLLTNSEFYDSIDAFKNDVNSTLDYELRDALEHSNYREAAAAKELKTLFEKICHLVQHFDKSLLW